MGWAIEKKINTHLQEITEYMNGNVLSISQKDHSYKIIISGGGTGGHVFPAIAIANSVKKLSPDAEILFVGALGRMEMEKVPEAGYRIKGLWISGLQRKSILKNLFLPFKIAYSFIKSYYIIKNFKPDMVIGVGGYASLPVMSIAALLKIPIIVQEQNSYPGMANKILGKYASKICIAYDGMEQYFPKNKLVVSGNPVRKDLKESKILKSDAVDYFNLDKEKKILLVLGGSLGAQMINRSIKNNLDLFKENDIQIIWQTGKDNYKQILNQLDNLDIDNEQVKVYAFIKNMNYAYAAADVILSRAGALTIAELAIVGKPVIVVPSPYVTENHQARNAFKLLDRGAAIIMLEKEVVRTLGHTIISLLMNEEKQKKLSRNISLLAKPEADLTIAKEAIKQIEKHRQI